MVGCVCMARGNGVCVAGEHAWQGAYVAGGMCGRRDSHCSGQYTPYWNAFLFVLSSVMLKLLYGCRGWYRDDSGTCYENIKELQVTQVACM